MPPTHEIPPKRPSLDQGTRTAWMMILLVVITILSVYCFFNFRSLAMEPASVKDKPAQEPVERSIEH